MAWQELVRILQPERYVEAIPGDSVVTPIEEIENDWEHGYNVAVVFIAAQYLAIELLYHLNTRDACLGQVNSWISDMRPMHEKLWDKKYQIIHRVVLNVAKYIHQGYAIAGALPARYDAKSERWVGAEHLNNIWEKTSELNRRKSFGVAAVVIDNLLLRLVDPNAKPIIEESDLLAISKRNLLIAEQQYSTHEYWAKMLQVSTLLSVTASEDGQELVEWYEWALRHQDPLINGCVNGVNSQDWINLRKYAATRAVELDISEQAAANVHHGWCKSQIKNPFRFPCVYEEGQEVGGRKKVWLHQLLPETQDEFLNMWSPDQILKQLGKQMTDEEYHDLNVKHGGNAYEMAADALWIEFDPRIIPYPSLTNKDKGNNVVATATTWLAYGFNRLRLHHEFQDTIDEISAMLLHGQDPFSYQYNPLISRHAAEMHAIWVAQALQRDGLDPSRKHQVLLFHFLPQYGQEGVGEWDDEPRYDVEAVVNSLTYLLIAYLHVLSQEEFVIDVSLDERTAVILDEVELVFA